jgi:hypothetical protein
MATPFNVMKAPVDVLPYTFDLGAVPWLIGTETIQSVSWSIPAPLIAVATTYSSTTAQVTLGGGILGKSYVVTCTVTTTTGRVKMLAFTINIEIC